MSTHGESVLLSSSQPEGTQVGWWSLSEQNERGYRQAAVVAGRMGASGMQLVQSEVAYDDGSTTRYSPRAKGINLVATSSAHGIRPETRVEPSGAGMRGLISPRPLSAYNKDANGLFASGDISPEVDDRVFCKDITELWPGIRRALVDTDNDHALPALYFNFNAAPYQIGKQPYATGGFDPKQYQVADPHMAPMTFKAMEMVKHQQSVTASVLDKLRSQRQEVLFEGGTADDSASLAAEAANYADKAAWKNLHEIPSALLFFDGPVSDSSSTLKGLGRRAEHLSRALYALTALHETENRR